MNWGDYLASSIPSAWASALPSEVLERIREIGSALEQRVGTERIVPEPTHVFRALSLPPDQVRVLLVGQDPYPNAAHAMGLSFSVPQSVTVLPGSARNIRTELASDLGIDLPSHFELLRWVDQGVLLLNRHLTSAVGNPGAHQSLGWDAVTDALIDTVVAHSPHAVAIIWGNQAAKLIPRLGSMPVIRSAHPSPLSAHRGFFGSRPFSQANALLAQAGLSPIDWRLEQPVASSEYPSGQGGADAGK